MDLFPLFAMLLVLALPVAAAPSATYGMADLEALAAEHSHQEFFQHALDVRPSERDAKWKGLVEGMGEDLLRRIAAKPRLERGDYERAEKLMGWTALAGHEFFRHQRQEIGLRWLDECLKADHSTTSPCWNDLLGFWAKDRQDPDLAPRLWSAVEPHLRSGEAPPPLSAYFILKPLFQSPLAELQCKKPDIREVLWREAQLEWARAPRAGEEAQTVLALAHSGCWDTLGPWLHGIWTSGAPVAQLALARALLEARGQLTPLESDLFHTAYLLGQPARGDTFNHAWNRVRELGRQPSRRDEILEKLSGWRPLPGEIFSDLDLSKRRVVANHLRRHFPEFLDHYAHTCLDFYGGRKRFPQGNPAHQCGELFDLAGKEAGLLPGATQEAFKRVR